MTISNGYRPVRQRHLRWPLPRWRKSFLWKHLAFNPTTQDLEYLEAFRRLLRARKRPTLQRLSEELGVRRQTVFQREQRAGLVPWLATELRLWRRGRGWSDVNGVVQPQGADVVGEALGMTPTNRDDR
jgi:hypothetical protein